MMICTRWWFVPCFSLPHGVLLETVYTSDCCFFGFSPLDTYTGEPARRMIRKLYAQSGQVRSKPMTSSRALTFVSGNSSPEISDRGLRCIWFTFQFVPCSSHFRTTSATSLISAEFLDIFFCCIEQSSVPIPSHAHFAAVHLVGTCKV